LAIGTVIIKPTKHCNAGCTYCAAPPEVNGAPKWSDDQFKAYFDKLAPYLAPRASLIWHGGEPMLMGPDFYWKAWDYVQSVKPGIRFSMQSNILGYETKRWKDLLAGPFQGSVSTSFDPDERHREYKGSTALYSKLFWGRFDAMKADGFGLKVIGTYTEETAPYAVSVYEKSLSLGDRCFNIRFNYRYPAGRDGGMGEMISPDTYGKMLVHLYDRWIVDLPDFVITPLDEMFKKVLSLETMRCPWTNECGGQFLGLEPNGDVYNCAEFADLGDPQFCFGNLGQQTVPELFASMAARAARRRRVDLPETCRTCRHFQECQGGCMRDTVLYGKPLGGKFHYCWSWMQVFDRIKDSIRTGEADGMVRRYNHDPVAVRRMLGDSAGYAAS